MANHRSAGNWRTKEGRTLEIAWMDSVHLMHSVNLTMRRVSGGALLPEAWRRSGPVKEAQRRGLLPDLLAAKLGLDLQHPVPERRETPAELCMLNALIEHGMFSEVPALRNVPEHVFKNVQRNHPEVWKTYAKHRLTR